MNSFGGVLVTTSKENFAINGGGSLEAMEKAYLQFDFRLNASSLKSTGIRKISSADSPAASVGLKLSNKSPRIFQYVIRNAVFLTAVTVMRQP